MGLTVSVGVIVPARFDGERPDVYATQTGQFCSIVTRLNRELAAHGLPTHSEPISVDGRPLDLRLGSSGNLHALRRIAAHLWLNGRLPDPEPEGPAAEDEPLLEYQEALEEHARGGIRAKRIANLPLRSYAHLVYHSDADGWYIPIDVEMPIFFEIDESPRPWTVGSTQALLRECTHLAGALRMPVNLNPRDPHWARRDLHRGGREPWRVHVAAAWVCCSLLAACRASLKWNAVVAFCSASTPVIEVTSAVSRVKAAAPSAAAGGAEKKARV